MAPMDSIEDLCCQLKSSTDCISGQLGQLMSDLHQPNSELNPPMVTKAPSSASIHTFTPRCLTNTDNLLVTQSGVNPLLNDLLSSQQSNLKSTSKSGRSRKKPPLPPSTFPIEHYLQPVLSSTSKGPILTIHLFSSSGVWSWLPSINLPISRSSHPLDAACTSSSLSRIIALCSGNPRDNSSFVLQAHRKTNS